jgi:hypothetical protein
MRHSGLVDIDHVRPQSSRQSRASGASKVSSALEAEPTSLLATINHPSNEAEETLLLAGDLTSVLLLCRSLAFQALL